MHKKLYDILFAINIVFQAAISGVVPGGLLFSLVYFLNRRFVLGDLFYALGITFSVLVGVYSLFKYAINATNILEKNKDRENS